MDHRILVLFAHPALERSRVQRRLLEAPRSLAGVTLHDLYERYPEYDVDVPREQALLRDHDVIVVQHPLYWYSVPPLVKQWIDLVLEHGWAYGAEGRALEGKRWLHALSCGAGEAAYRAEGLNRHPLDDFLRPLEQTARLCHMEWRPPFVVYGTHRLDAAAIAAHVAAYRRRLEALRAGRDDAPAETAPRPAASAEE